MGIVQTIFDSVTKSQGYTKENTSAKPEKKFFSNFAPMPIAITRWSQKDVEKAIVSASMGDLRIAAQLMESAKGDGVVRGVLSSRSDGLVSLPRKIKGREDMVEILEGNDTKSGIFDVMVPPGEAAKMAADAALLAVSVARMCTEDTGIPYANRVLHRMDPQFLSYDWSQDTWFFQAANKGRVPITPGMDGWVLYLHGGNDTPWNQGAWKAVGRAYVVKEHAFYNRLNYASKIAFPARIGYTTENSTEKNRLKFITQILQWGVATAFALPQGWDAKLLESNGRGYEIFKDQIAGSDQEIMIALTGQTVTTMGTSGFSSGNIHQAIRLDIIQSTAESLSACINSQILKPWANEFFGGDALEESPEVSWDTTPPSDREALGKAMTSLSDGIAKSGQGWGAVKLDIIAIADKMGIPAIVEEQGPVEEEASAAAPIFAYHIDGGVVSINEVRQQLGLPYDIKFGNMTKPEYLASLGIAPAGVGVAPEVPVDAPIEVTTQDPLLEGIPEMPQGPDYAESLAASMTKAQMRHCEHGRVNECDWCGVERDRELGTDEKGESKYLIKWRPIIHTPKPSEIKQEAIGAVVEEAPLPAKKQKAKRTLKNRTANT